MSVEWFAGRLRELREQSTLTQGELANRAGMTREGIAQLETGRRKPTWETVLTLAETLGVSTEAFRQAPLTADKPGPGRPAKAKPDAAKGKAVRPRGRPRKGK